MDPFVQFKERAKEAWSTFAAMEQATGSVAPKVVKLANVSAGQSVLDVGCGTGVVSLAAARTGAKVWGADLTPELVARAKEHAALAKAEIQFEQADVEALPYPDGKFDVVLSQFGHMFAPRPEVAVKEMLRVLKPGGTIAFATWPAHFFTGRLFSLTSKYGPPPPAGLAPVTRWGDPKVIEERLGDAVTGLSFTMDTMWPPALSIAHARHTFESFGPMGKLVAALTSSDPAKLAVFRQELDALIGAYFEENRIRQDFLLTRATKV